MKKQIQKLLEQVLEDMGLEESVTPQISVPENPEHGDYSTNVAMVLFPNLPKFPNHPKSPKEFAEELKDMLQKYQTTSGAGIIDRVEVAPPGFLNIFVSEASLSTELAEVLKMGNVYGNVTKSHSAEATRDKSASINPSKKSQKTEKITVSQAGEKSTTPTTLNPLNIPRKTAAIDYAARQNGKKSEAGEQEIISAQRIIIEFADPNPFKEIHIGHVRNIALGESFCRLTESQGNVVRRANYEGDVGLHVAKAMYGNARGAPWERAYAEGSKAFEADPDAKNEIGEMNKKMYAGGQTYAKEYAQGRKWSLDRFEGVYRRLGTHFDRYYFESEVAPIGIELVEKHIDDAIFEKSDGAVIYRGEKAGLHTRVFITKEHYATYEAKDLALAPLKYAEWPYDLSIIMTGNEQSEYFKVMLAALAEINPDLASRTRHMPFGMVNLKTGKMSSRTGSVITADWLIEEAKRSIYKILDKTASSYTQEQKDRIAEKAAIAAIKYSMLRVNASSDIAFDMEASVSFEGDSGPYLQYTYARARSVLRKASSPLSPLVPLSPLSPEERLLGRLLVQFSDVVAEAAQNFAPNTLCTYLFHLAQEFNTFYAKNPILGNSTRLALTAATAQVIKNGLYLLGIEVLEQM